MTRPLTDDDLGLAFEIVSQLARQGILVAHDDSMVDEAARQTEGVNMFEDFIANHHEELEDLLMGDGGFPAITDEHGEIPEIDLDEIRGVTLGSRNDPWAISLELACQQIRDGHIENDHEIEVEGDALPAGLAIDIVGAFWERYGRQILENTVTIAPFQPDDGPSA